MILVVFVFLWLSLLFYLLSGGADFGAGIVELFASKEDKSEIRRMMHSATGPIWEANHMWLILAVVILFVGFPGFYAQTSTYFYIPLTLMLLGIIGRGTSYAFRYGGDDSYGLRKLDSYIYLISSVVTPLFLGMVAAGVFEDSPTGSPSFLNNFLFNWFNWFSVSVGVFAVLFCGFLAVIYIIGNESYGDFRYKLIPIAAKFNVAIIVTLIVIFLTSGSRGILLFQVLTTGGKGFLALLIFVLTLLLIWWNILKRNAKGIRLIIVFQVISLQMVFLWIRFPAHSSLNDLEQHFFIIEQSNAKTINALALALIIGSLFILPALAYLVYRFEVVRKFARLKKGITYGNN